MNREIFIEEKLKDLKTTQIQTRPNSTIYLDANNNFIIEKERNKIYCSYYEIWNVLETNYKMTYIDVQEYLKPILEKYFGINNVIPLCRYSVKQHEFNIQKINF